MAVRARRLLPGDHHPYGPDGLPWRDDDDGEPGRSVEAILANEALAGAEALRGLAAALRAPVTLDLFPPPPPPGGAL